MDFSLTGNCRDKAELCEDLAGERTGRAGTAGIGDFKQLPEKKKIKIILKINQEHNKKELVVSHTALPL